MSIEKMAQALAGFGRYGDSELVHMNPEEVRILEQLAGQRMTTNPVTGRQEAFSLGKLLAGIGALAAAPFTGGATLPLLATLGGSLAASSLSGGKKKSQDVPASDARKYVDALYERRRQEAEQRGFPIIALESTGPQPLDLLGREQTYLQPMGGGFRPPGNPPPRFAEGGEMEEDDDYEESPENGMSVSVSIEPEEQQRDHVYMAACDALCGRSMNPEKALNDFVRTYGQEALQSLAQQVQSGNPLSKMGGMVRGPGAGMDDMVTGSIGGNQKVLLSNDEFVIPADVVSGLGDGSSEAGARELYAMMDRVRRERTGTTKQPKKLKKGSVLPI